MLNTKCKTSLHIIIIYISNKSHNVYKWGKLAFILALFWGISGITGITGIWTTIGRSSRLFEFEKEKKNNKILKIIYVDFWLDEIPISLFVAWNIATNGTIDSIQHLNGWTNEWMNDDYYDCVMKVIQTLK